MSKLRWAKPVRRYSSIPILNVRNRERVILCAKPLEFCSLYLHYTNRSSVPCTGDTCPQCLRGALPELQAYAPCLHKDAQDGGFTKAVLCVGSPFGEVAERDLRGCVVTLDRRRRNDGTVSNLIVVDASPVDPAILHQLGYCWFDVKPRMLQRWGIEPADAGEDDTPVVDPREPDRPLEPDPFIIPFPQRPPAA